MGEETTVPRDEFSTTLRQQAAHPGSVTKQSIVEITDFYGNLVSWIVKTIRIEGNDTIFVQRQTATSADRLVIPPEVTAVMARHRGAAVKVNRRRGAQAAAATREARGIKSTFGRKGTK